MIREYQVVGMTYCTQEILALATENPAYAENKFYNNRKIFRFKFTNSPVLFAPEPQNPHDRNAIAVMIAGRKIGYIASSENTELLAFLQRRMVTGVSAFIGGGEYKVKSQSGDVLHGSYGFYARVTVTLQDPPAPPTPPKKEGVLSGLFKKLGI